MMGFRNGKWSMAQVMECVRARVCRKDEEVRSVRW